MCEAFKKPPEISKWRHAKECLRDTNICYRKSKEKILLSVLSFHSSDFSNSAPDFLYYNIISKDKVNLCSRKDTVKVYLCIMLHSSFFIKKGFSGLLRLLHK